jgi:peptidoglycan-associated lipoprotein
MAVRSPGARRGVLSTEIARTCSRFAGVACVLLSAFGRAPGRKGGQPVPGKRTHTEERAMDTMQTQGVTGKRARKLAIVIGIPLTLVAGAMGVYWGQSQDIETGAGTTAASVASTEPATATPGTTDSATVVTVPAAAPVEVTSVQAPIRTVAAAPAETEAYHADVYFDFKSTRLRADAVRVLQEKAAQLDAGGAWGVLVQGHADRHGPAEYNRALAQRRAEAVKQFLVELGVPETSVKTVTIGQEGSLCDEPSKECQQLNRRVHIEIRKLAGVVSAPVRPAIAEDDSPATTADAPASLVTGQ